MSSALEGVAWGSQMGAISEASALTGKARWGINGGRGRNIRDAMTIKYAKNGSDTYMDTVIN